MLISFHLCILFLTLLCQACWGKHLLQMLTLLSHNGKGQLTMPACDEAIQIVLEHSNDRQDILPGFQLTNQVADEGVAARESNRAIIDFEREIEDNSSVTKAPIIFGPSRACDFAGLTTKELGYVSVSPQCGGAYVVRMKAEFNLPLFSVQQPGSIALMSMLYFIKNIGHWNEIGLITLRNNKNLLELAEIVEKIATENDVNVLHYDSEMEVSRQSIVNMKNANVRVLVITIGQPAMCLDIWCWAYREGMRGPSHVFLFHIFNCITIDLSTAKIPDGCTKEEIAEQIGSSFAVGNSLEHSENVGNVVTPLGYNYDEFEKEYERRSFGKGFADPQFRHACHDSALLGVLAMNATENILNEKYNTSLENFDDNRHLVQSVLTESILDLHFTGLRIGNMSYSKKNKHVSESNYIVQIHNGSLLYLLELKPMPDENGTIKLENVQLIKKMADPIWNTPSGKAPKDLSSATEIVESCGLSMQVIFALLSGLLAIFQTMTTAQYEKLNYNLSWKLALIFSFLLLNVSVFLHAIGLDIFDNLTCRFFIPLVILAVTLLTIFLTKISQCFYLVKLKHEEIKMTSSFKFVNFVSGYSLKSNQSFGGKKVTPKAIAINHGNLINPGVVFLILISFVLSAIAIAVLPMKLETSKTKPFFNIDSDSYEFRVEKLLKYSNSLYLFGPILLVNMIVLLFINLNLYKIAKTPMLKANNSWSIFSRVRLAILHLFLAQPSSFLLLAVASTASYCIQTAIIYSIILIFSFSCHIIMFNPF